MATHAHTTMTGCRVLLGLAVLWAFIGLVGGVSWANDDEPARATLRGVEGVKVVVEDIEPEVERLGLTKQQLQTDVELQLRQVGIPVLTREEQGKTPDYSWLYVDVHVLLRPELPLAIFHINIELRQLASLATKAPLVDAPTWSVGYLGSVGSARLSDIRKDVRDVVDRFINAYLSVHPHAAGSAALPSASPRRDLVRQVQERLQTVGFNPGTIDGTMGPQTQQALRWFQNTKGLRSSVDLDEPTLNALGIR